MKPRGPARLSLCFGCWVGSGGKSHLRLIIPPFEGNDISVGHYTSRRDLNAKRSQTCDILSKRHGGSPVRITNGVR